MTYEEFKKHAEHEIDAAILTEKNRLLNLVNFAWGEGKRHAEVEALSAILKEALDAREGSNT